MATQIIKCSCKHPFQDSLYGAGNRVGNEQRTGMVRCTVCGTVGGTKSTYVAPKTETAAAPVKSAEPKEKGKAERKKSMKTKVKVAKEKPAAKPAKAKPGAKAKIGKK